MIRIVLYQDGAGRFTGFSVKGHSGYAEEGSDIVCSAVSALTITCVNSIEAVCGIVPLLEGGENGYLKVVLPPDRQTNHDVQVLLKALHVGLKDIAEAYSQYVNLSIQERRETT